MQNKKRRIVTSALVVAVISLGALAYAIARVRQPFKQSDRPTAIPVARQVQQQDTKTEIAHARNLSLQPQAFMLSRRLGSRFAANKGESSVGGTLTLGSEQKGFQITRKQIDTGEQIQISFTGDSKLLTWDASTGALASGARAAISDRDMIERLVFDSPDQFLLAQLRGASYYTVARNVRPAGQKVETNGTLWNIVRVDDPEQDEAKRPQSRWRLYYLNAVTGLIDRIESEVEGQRIVAEISGWTDYSGEKVPSQIIWMRQGQTLMQYRLTTFSRVVG